MNVLIIGSGAREHAIAWKLNQSEYCEKIFLAPGNAGTTQFGTTAAVDIHDFAEVAKFATDFNIMMIVVGAENTLVDGIHDYFQSSEYLKHILVIGPKKAGAMLEGSKDYCKAFFQRNNIPTARYQTFTEDTFGQAAEYLRNHNFPVVLKADGLAAGKGVIIAQDYDQAIDTLEDMLRNKRFGNASSKVVIEEYLEGIEVSVFILTDGKDYVLLPEAKDYKRIGEGDTGLNTGGMGAISPVPFVDDVFMQKVKERVIDPTLRGMQEEQMDYTGFLFIGLMNVNGEPYVIEYNVRLGDPETEAILPRIKSDLFELFRALHDRKLGEFQLEIDPRTATTVFLVSGGYPEGFEKGKEISGIENVPSDVLVFHAGTKMVNGKLVNSGGRVIAVTALADTMEEALAKANAAAETITWQDRYYRHDIGFDLRQTHA
ncbi:phosphoribosylamine--glycine ligase [Pontibacter diazotrophicus]|uniref:Phosphoribosylamine--glycine ligase n=1 Tax=Pontibacter diazotrophicus TaxID=1400979 RepID=A0A3D8LCE5_9BACT|nr:phosphoribosylamine--glycine ligase [Pontibacter diazotrophicus]RDV15087.1 phosphoribosylamine--glycine ligase [Pontibacter diazotrophicus]